MSGRRSSNPNLKPDKFVTAEYGVRIKNKDIPYYVDEYFYSALNAWQMTKLWGLAHGERLGWAEEPLEYIDAITILESENNKWEAEEREKKTKPNVKGKA